MEVTRELVHVMPAHVPLQGSEPTQLGIVLCQESLRDFRASTAGEFTMKSQVYISVVEPFNLNT